MTQNPFGVEQLRGAYTNSGVQTTGLVEIAVPRAYAPTQDALAIVLGAQTVTALTSPEISSASRMFAFPASLAPSKELEFQVDREKEVKVPADPVVRSNWNDVDTGLVLEVVVDGTARAVAIEKIVADAFETSGFVECGFGWARIEGTPVVLEVQMDRKLGEDQVEFEISPIFSDPTDPDVDWPLERIELRAAYPLVLDYGEKIGAEGPMSVPNSSGGHTLTVYSTENDDEEPRRVGEGQRFPTLRGAVLTYGNDDLGAIVGDPDQLQRLSRLLSRQQSGRRVGLLEWGIYDFPSGVTQPRVAEDRKEIVNRVGRWIAELAEPGDPWEQRPLGFPRYGGTPGAQDDFGSFKGLEGNAWLQTLAWPFLLWADGTPLRPIFRREADGSRVLFSNHPNWRTRAMMTHWSTSRSPDRLGKGPGRMDSNGWTGIDRQHQTFNRFYFNASRWPSRIYNSMALDLAEVLRANHRRPDLDGTNSSDDLGGSRAHGRALHSESLVWALTYLESEEGGANAFELIRAEVDLALRTRENPPGPIKPLVAHRRTDRRKLGGRHPYWVAWEEGLALHGQVAAARMLSVAAADLGVFAESTENVLVDLIAIMREVVQTLVLGGFFQTGDGAWNYVQDVRWVEGGIAPEIDRYLAGDPEWVHGVNRNFLDWMIPGLRAVLIGGEPWAATLRGSLDADVLDRLTQIVVHYERIGALSTDWRQREWWGNTTTRPRGDLIVFGKGGGGASAARGESGPEEFIALSETGKAELYESNPGQKIDLDNDQS